MINNYSLSKDVPDVLSTASSISSMLGSVPLNSASVRVTSRCQARCCFCSSSSNDARIPETPTNTILHWLKQISSLGAQRLFITGGEPTLRSDIGQIINGAQDLGFEVVMSTNGLRFDLKIAENLKNSGLSHLQISLHGIAATHDRLVGVSGAHRSVIDAICLFSSYIEKVSVAMTITSDNLPEVEFVIEEALSAGANWVALHPVMVVGRAKPSLAPKLKDVLKKLNHLVEIYRERLALMLPPALVPTRAQKEAFGFGYLCTFPDMIAIDAQGTVAPCDSLLSDTKWQLGDLRIHSLKKILASEQAAQWRNLSENPAGKLEGICRYCKFLHLCCGGCRALSYFKHGHWNAPDIWCEEAFDSGIFPETSLRGESFEVLGNYSKK